MALVYRRSEPKEDRVALFIIAIASLFIWAAWLEWEQHKAAVEQDRRDVRERNESMRELDRELERLNAELERDPEEN